MNWIYYAILMYISSVVLYLIIRKSQIQKIPGYLANLAMFLIPAVIFLFVNILLKQSFALPINQLLMLIGGAFFFGYIGNVASLKSIKLAPNPGYSLIISKSYVVFTSIVSVLIFKSILTSLDILAIILIIGFSALIMIGKVEKKDSHHMWLWYSITAFFCWGFLALFSKYILDMGMNVYIYIFYFMSFVTVFIGIEMFLQKEKIKLTPDIGKMLVIMGILSALFNLFMQLGYKTAPNPGFINAANAGSISLLTIMSALIYKDDLSIKKVIGVIGVTGGLILLFIK